MTMTNRFHYAILRHSPDLEIGDRRRRTKAVIAVDRFGFSVYQNGLLVRHVP